MAPKENWIKDWLKRQKKNTPASPKSVEKPKERKKPDVINRDYEQDESYGPLEELMNEGYDTVELVTPNTACDKCTPHAGEKVLADWLDELVQTPKSPIFEWTHPGCSSCYLVVSSSDNEELTPKMVHRDGSVEEA